VLDVHIGREFVRRICVVVEFGSEELGNAACAVDEQLLRRPFNGEFSKIQILVRRNSSAIQQRLIFGNN